MMMIPRRRDDFDLFGDLFSDPFFERKENKLMKTDIKEKGDNYLIDIDLPGYDKENIRKNHGFNCGSYIYRNGKCTSS